MPNAAVGDICLYTHWGQLLGQRIMTQWHFHLDTLNGTFPSQDQAITDLANYLAGAYGLETAFLNTVPTNYFLDRRWAQIVWPVRTRRLEFGLSTPGTGLTGTETANLAASIERYSQYSGRWAQGRINPPIPAVGTTVLIGGSLSPAQVARCDALGAKCWGQLTIPVSGVKWTHMLYDSSAHTGSIFLPLVGAKTQTSVRVMRRRTVGLGI